MQRKETGTKERCREIEAELRAAWKDRVRDNAQRHNMHHMSAAEIIHTYADPTIHPPTPGASGSRDYGGN